MFLNQKRKLVLSAFVAAQRPVFRKNEGSSIDASKTRRSRELESRHDVTKETGESERGKERSERSQSDTIKE